MSTIQSARGCHETKGVAQIIHQVFRRAPGSRYNDDASFLENETQKTVL